MAQERISRNESRRTWPVRIRPSELNAAIPTVSKPATRRTSASRGGALAAQRPEPSRPKSARSRPASIPVRRMDDMTRRTYSAGSSRLPCLGGDAVRTAPPAAWLGGRKRLHQVESRCESRDCTGPEHSSRRSRHRHRPNLVRGERRRAQTSSGVGPTPPNTQWGIRRQYRLRSDLVMAGGPRKRRPRRTSFNRLKHLKYSGAGEGIRTLDPNLGKVVLYP
jgi:hypothetical protein